MLRNTCWVQDLLERYLSGIIDVMEHKTLFIRFPHIIPFPAHPALCPRDRFLQAFSLLMIHQWDVLAGDQSPEGEAKAVLPAYSLLADWLWGAVPVGQATAPGRWPFSISPAFLWGMITSPILLLFDLEDISNNSSATSPTPYHFVFIERLYSRLLIVFWLISMGSHQKQL